MIVVITDLYYLRYDDNFSVIVIIDHIRSGFYILA